jgi:hypothetical protein
LNGRKAAGRVTQVDDGWDLVTRHSWHILEEGRPGRARGPFAMACVKRAGGRWTTVRMHCLIMGCADISHRDGDGLNNQRANLLLATDGQPETDGTSRFTGVRWDSRRQLWQAEITVRQRRLHLGRFPAEEQAARAYDTAARDAWGALARLNLGGHRDD